MATTVTTTNATLEYDTTVKRINATDEITTTTTATATTITTSTTTINSILTSYDALPTAIPLTATTNSIQYDAQNDDSSKINNNWFNQTDIHDMGDLLGTAAPLKSSGMGSSIGCSMSEFTCTNSKCIPTNKYCDRVNDCGDNSDEPRFCTRE